jgi:hypothetical protein
MAYATRLGLWGIANPLYPTFDSFKEALTRRGVGAMEMLALEMKLKGLFASRTLSWEGADFHTVEVRLCQKQVRPVSFPKELIFSFFIIPPHFSHLSSLLFVLGCNLRCSGAVVVQS